MNLKDYLSKHKITQQEFAEKFDPPISQARVSHWLTRRLRVSLADAVQIQRMTNGEVRVEDWLVPQVGAGETPPPAQEVA